jgi:hypothetical protein
MAPVLDLPTVTLLAVDTRSPALALRALQHCRRQARFAQCLLLGTGAPPPGLPAGIGWRDIGPIDSAAAYSRFVLGNLLAFVQTEHLLIAQWDGFIADASAWDPSFLETDYLGAPWGKAHHGHWVGNGGFSLRSRRLLQALQAPALQARWHHPEDTCIAQTLRAELEAEHGIRFGSRAQAQRFAFENEPPPGRCFGFHGAFNLHRVLPAAELAYTLAALPDSVLTSRDGFKTARALLRDGHRVQAARLLQRRLALGARDWRTRWLAWRAGAVAG